MKFNLNLDSINYIKIVYKDNNDKTNCIKAAIKRMGEREIFACSKFEDENIRIKTPQDISLSFVCDNGLYRTTTELKYTEKDDSYTYFALKTPQGLEYQQNREYFRVRLQEDVLLTFIENGNRIVMPAKTHDISANGVRLILDREISAIEPVLIELLFKPKAIKAKAEFVRTDNEDGIYKVSFHFLDLPDADTDLISQICIQKQLEYKRKSYLTGNGDEQ